MKDKKNYVVYIMQELHLIRVNEYTNRLDFMNALDLLQNVLGVMGRDAHVEIKEGETCVLGFVGLE